MLYVSCRDVAIDCEFVGKANNEGELMMQLIDHIVKTHRARIGEIMKPELRERIKARTKKS
jgi:predicted small metal-binding protein